MTVNNSIVRMVKPCWCSMSFFGGNRRFSREDLVIWPSRLSSSTQWIWYKWTALCSEPYNYWLTGCSILRLDAYSLVAHRCIPYYSPTIHVCIVIHISYDHINCTLPILYTQQAFLNVLTKNMWKNIFWIDTLFFLLFKEINGGKKNT